MIKSPQISTRYLYGDSVDIDEFDSKVLKRDIDCITEGNVNKDIDMVEAESEKDTPVLARNVAIECHLLNDSVKSGKKGCRGGTKKTRTESPKLLVKLKCYNSKTGKESPKNASKIISKMKLGGSQYIKSDKKVEKIAKSGEKVSVNSIKKYFETISGSQASSFLKADSEVEEVVKIMNKVEDKESVKDRYEQPTQRVNNQMGFDSKRHMIGV